MCAKLANTRGRFERSERKGRLEKVKSKGHGREGETCSVNRRRFERNGASYAHVYRAAGVWCTDKSRVFPSFFSFSSRSFSFSFFLFVFSFYRRDTALPLYIVVLISALRQWSATFCAIKNELVSELCDYISNKSSRRGDSALPPRLYLRTCMCVCMCLHRLLLRVACILYLPNLRKVDTRSLRERTLSAV